MGHLNASKYEDAQVAFSAKFNAALEAMRLKMDAAWQLLAYSMPMDGPTLELKWIGDVPAMTEWIGERKLSKLRIENYRVTTKKWANGFEVDEDDIEDDKLNLYTGKIAALARKAVTHRMNLISSFLINGFATTVHGAGYDGKAFFADDHLHAGAGAAQSNLIHVTLDDTGALDSAFEKMISLVDESGEPLGLNPTHLFYGPKYRATVNSLIKAERLANGASNTNFGAVQPVLVPKLVGAYDDYWYLADLSMAGDGIAPIIWGQRRDPRLRLQGPGVGGQESDASFMQGKARAGADYRANAAYGLWETIVGSDGTS